MAGDVRLATFAELPAETAYRLWALRSRVFVVEQDCPYLDLDGRDTDPSARHLWVEGGGVPVATLRLLSEEGAADRTRGDRGRAPWIGPGRRAGGCRPGAGGERDVVLDAQSHLVDWYARFGFEPSGRGFLEDGIPHTPLRRRGPRPTR